MIDAKKSKGRCSTASFCAGFKVTRLSGYIHNVRIAYIYRNKIEKNSISFMKM